MKYIPPFGSADPNAPYVNATPTTPGSNPSAKFFNNVQAEIIAAIEAEGFEPTDGISQLALVIASLNHKIDAAATSGAVIAKYSFSKETNEFLPPAPDTFTDVPADARLQLTYFDFTTNTPYTAAADLTGWIAGDVYIPPVDIDIQFEITKKMWDNNETPNNDGGRVFWSHINQEWFSHPSDVSLENAELTGIPTAPTPDITSPGNQISNKEYVDGQLGNIMTPGIIMPFAGPVSTLPGYLLCDGSEVSRTTYAALFSAIGTLYGAGDENSTFNIPDFRGMFLRGAGSELSAAIGTLQLDAAPNISGEIQLSYVQSQSLPNGATGPFYTSPPLFNGSSRSNDSWNIRDNNRIGFDASKVNPSYGRNYTTEIRPKNYAIQYFIKY